MLTNEQDYVNKKRAKAAIAKIKPQLDMPGFKPQYAVLKKKLAKNEKILKDIEKREAKAKEEAKKASGKKENNEG